MSFNILRFSGFEKKEYEIEVVTPLFLGGADSKKAEIRAPSFKGMLRFWWRALNPQLGVKGFKDLYMEESDIFGNTEKKSKISLKIEESDIQTKLGRLEGQKFEVKGKGNIFDILHYLAYGTMKQKGNVLIKEYITPKSRFKISIQGPKSYIGAAELALKYLLSFGGLGAKSRNGFGSLYCKDIEYISNITKKNEDLIDYSAFSGRSKLIKFPPKEKWEDALSDIGLAYKDARLSLEARHSFTRRGLIAKPIEAQNEKNIPKYVRGNRQAKPYFLHVNKLDGKYQGQILFMPYKFKTTDKSETLKDYLDACEGMNQEIQKKAGGNKWQ